MPKRMTTYEIALRPTRNILNTRIPNEVVDKIFEYLPNMNDLLIKYHKKHKEIADDDDENDREHFGKLEKKKLPPSFRVEHTLYMKYFGGMQNRVYELQGEFKNKTEMEQSVILTTMVNIFGKYANKIYYKNDRTYLQSIISRYKDLDRLYRQRQPICMEIEIERYYTNLRISGVNVDIVDYERFKRLNRYGVARLYHIWRNMYDYERYEDIPEYKRHKHINPNIIKKLRKK